MIDDKQDTTYTLIVNDKRNIIDTLIAEKILNFYNELVSIDKSFCDIFFRKYSMINIFEIFNICLSNVQIGKHKGCSRISIIHVNNTKQPVLTQELE